MILMICIYLGSEIWMDHENCYIVSTVNAVNLGTMFCSHNYDILEQETCPHRSGAVFGQIRNEFQIILHGRIYGLKMAFRCLQCKA
jgi:hypothetical protein